MRDFCSQLAATPEGNALFCLQIANGLYGEWHQFGFLHHDPDTGDAATRSFRAWLRARYETDAGLARAWHQPAARLDAVLPPDSPARERADCGPLRDPQKQQAVIDYFTWLHTTMAAEIASCGGATADFKDWTSYAFGEPSVTPLDDGTILVTLWALQPSGNGIRYVKLRIE